MIEGRVRESASWLQKPTCGETQVIVHPCNMRPFIIEILWMLQCIPEVRGAVPHSPELFNRVPIPTRLQTALPDVSVLVGPFVEHHCQCQEYEPDADEHELDAICMHGVTARRDAREGIYTRPRI